MNENSYAKISGALSKLNAARENLIHIITNVGLPRRWVWFNIRYAITYINRLWEKNKTATSIDEENVFNTIQHSVML